MSLIVTFCRRFGWWDGAGNSAGTWIPEELFVENNDVDISIWFGFPLRKRLRNVERRPNEDRGRVETVPEA